MDSFEYTPGTERNRFRMIKRRHCVSSTGQQQPDLKSRGPKL
jgi:hypothetical protein